MSKWLLPAMALAILVALGGCSDDGGESKQAATPAQAAGTNQPAASASGSPAPTVTVKSDKTHAVQPNDELTLSIEVSDFTLDASKLGQRNEPGIGHYRVYLDEASGDDFLTSGAATSTRVTVPGDITDGSHELRVVLQNNDRSPVNPLAEARVLLIVYRL